MANFKAAERYARALYQMAVEKGTVPQTLADIQYFQKTILENRNLANAIASPILSGSKKQSILDAIFGAAFQDLTNAFFKLIVSKGRERELPSIVTAFIQEDKLRKGIKDGKLVSAGPLPDDLRQSLAQQARKMAGGEVVLEETVDPSLIGGFVLSVQGLQLDESVKTKLTKLREQLVDTSYIPKIDLI
jgi:F-type H+-transporting ATPase subunit delta